MFTGIIEKIGRVVRPGRRLGIDTSYPDLKPGESVAISGVCLTVVKAAGGIAEFDVVPETLKRTTLGGLKRGSFVNIERPLRMGDRLGGHWVQGHVDGTGRVTRLRPYFRVETALAREMVPKGSIAIDGVSMTVVDVDCDSFTLAVIPTTRRLTTLGKAKPGTLVNLETDIIGKYALRRPRLSKAYLKKAGFI